jgi:hypothetical protein
MYAVEFSANNVYEFDFLSDSWEVFAQPSRIRNLLEETYPGYIVAERRVLRTVRVLFHRAPMVIEYVMARPSELPRTTKNNTPTSLAEGWEQSVEYF